MHNWGKLWPMTGNKMFKWQVHVTVRIDHTYICIKPLTYIQLLKEVAFSNMKSEVIFKRDINKVDEKNEINVWYKIMKLLMILMRLSI